MSNVLAIAATTRTLRNLLLTRMPALDAELSDLEVTLQPPDIARKGTSKAQFNLFLYQVVANAAWRNLDMPGQVRPGESAPPPLALNLHYLITAWGRGESDIDAISHRVLAAAMSTLHDRVVLDGNDIAQRTARQRPGQPVRAGADHARCRKAWMSCPAVDRVPDQLPRLRSVRGRGGADRQPVGACGRRCRCCGAAHRIVACSPPPSAAAGAGRR